MVQENIVCSVLSPGTGIWEEIDPKGTASSDGVAKEDSLPDVQVNNARDRLQRMLLSSLQMEHVVVLAGSGCSVNVEGCGGQKGPSMWGLWEAVMAQSDHDPSQKPSEAQQVREEGASKGRIPAEQSNIGQRVGREAKLVAQTVHFDLEDQANHNVEAFLSQIETWIQLGAKEGHEDVLKFLASSKRKILQMCSDFVEEAELPAHKSFLHRLSRRRTRDQRLKVFTTNYDLCFERAAAELGCVPLDGFSFSFPRRYNPRFFDYDIVRRQSSVEGHGTYLEGVFHLYKLHGSVNWERQDDGTIVEKQAPTPERACLIYPARDKYQHSYAMPYLESISRYLTAVRQPNTCVVVVGFGFNDDHLSQPLLTAVESNPHLRLIVVDPSIRCKAEGLGKATCGEGQKALVGDEGESVDHDSETVVESAVDKEITTANVRPDGKEQAKPPTANHFQKAFLRAAQRGADVWFINATFDGFAELIPDLQALTPAERLAQAIQGLQKGGLP